MNKALAIAVHPDDETLGCGGVLLKHKVNGDEIYWLIVTTIDEGHPSYAKRRAEIERVSQEYGFSGVYSLDIPTMRVDEQSMSELVGKISKVFNEVRPNIVYLPFKNDVHSDHRKVFEAAYSCTKSFRYPFIKKILMMEVLSETEFAPSVAGESFAPNVFVDITPFFEKKLEIMRIYESELGAHPFPRSERNLTALATLRGATGGGRICGEFYAVKGDKLSRQKTAFFSVVFDGVQPFLKDYFDSLQAQTDKNFDLYLINDGLKDLNSHLPQNLEFSIFVLDTKGTPAETREYGINKIKELGYEYLIFGDADDYFENNRVEILTALLAKHDIVVNDFDVVDANAKVIFENYLSHRLQDGEQITFEHIKHKNFIGLTNSAINLSKCLIVSFNHGLVAVDWYLFSMLLLRNLSTVFTSRTKTYYRRHGFNVIGINDISESKILKGIEVKELQYRELSNIDQSFVPYSTHLAALKEKINDNTAFKNSFLEFTTTEYNKIEFPLWWEEIKIAEEFYECQTDK